MRVACLFVPDLALQAVVRERFESGAADVPLGLVPPRDPGKATDRRTLLACTAAARAAGVRRGMTPAAARGACPAIIIVEESPERTREALEALGEALGCFSPTVMLSPPEAVLLDLTRLATAGLGSLEPEVLVRVAADLGFVGRAAIAETRFAARARAEYGDRLSPDDLPLAAAGLPAVAAEALAVVGLRTLADLAALPPQALARRFGPEVRDVWLELTGRRAPALEAWRPVHPVCERSRHEEEPLERLDPLCFRLKTLCDRAVARLSGRGQGAEEVSLDFELDAVERTLVLDEERRLAAQPSHRITIDLGHACGTAKLLLDLLRERIAVSPPAGPVVGMTLTVTRARAERAGQLDLFADRAPAEPMEVTVARLTALFGARPRVTAELREDYRPERAWELVPFGSTRDAAPPPGPRPTRVLPEPVPLERFARSWAAPPGAVSGPERLVGGWWDGAPVARDYWVIEDGQGHRRWVYRDLDTDGWFLQGWFD